MNAQQRLEAISALTKAASHLSITGNDKIKLMLAIQEMQAALDALKIDSLNVDDNSLHIAKAILNK